MFFNLRYLVTRLKYSLLKTPKQQFFSLPDGSKRAVLMSHHSMAIKAVLVSQILNFPKGGLELVLKKSKG